MDLERLFIDKERHICRRFYSSAYLLMAFSSLRFSDVKAVFVIWRSSTAICGRSIDKKQKSRPIITWETPSQGFTSKGKCDGPLFPIWEKRPPSKGGNRALCRFCNDSWETDPTHSPPYYTFLKMFKKIFEFLGHEKPKWTLRSARAWFPTCANQLGRSEDGRRRLGHWDPGSQMMETYDRDVCATELRLGRSISGMITDRKWSPTAAFEAPRPISDTNEGSVVPGITPTVEIVQPMTPITEEIEGDTDEGPSTSSMTWGNKSDGLSEVDIADLYSEGTEHPPPHHRSGKGGRECAPIFQRAALGFTELSGLGNLFD